MEQAERLAQLVAQRQPDAGVVGVVVEPLGPDQLVEMGRHRRAGRRPSRPTLPAARLSFRDSWPEARHSAAAPRRVRGWMALSDDQRAMLRLLAQREQGYEDIAALMGLSVDEVRAKVDDALAPARGRRRAGAAAAGAEPRSRSRRRPSRPARRRSPSPSPRPSLRPSRAAAPQPGRRKARRPQPRPPQPPTPKRSPSAAVRSSLCPAGSGARAAIAAGVLVLGRARRRPVVSGGGGSDSTTRRRHRHDASKPTTAAAQKARPPSSNAERSDQGGPQPGRRQRR